MRRSLPWFATCLLSACSPETKPATQVMVAVNSDFVAVDELKRIRVEVFPEGGGDRPIATRDFQLRRASDTPSQGTTQLPFSMSLMPPDRDPAERFRVVTLGYASNSPDAEPIVEQKVIAAFAREQTLLLEVFLARLCEGQLCDRESTCYLSYEGRFKAGECGTIPQRELASVRPDDALEQARWPEPATRTDGGVDPDGGDLDPSPIPELELPPPPAARPAPLVASAVVDASCPPLPSPSTTLCTQADPFADAGSVPPLAFDGGCAVFESSLKGQASRAFSLTWPKHEPTQVELQYAANGNADLGLETRPNGPGLVFSKQPRGAAEETERVLFNATAGRIGELEVTGTAAQACQPFALRVNHNFCSDSLEDNDTTDTPTQVTWDEHGRAAYHLSSYPGDEDHFLVTTQRGDPVRITGAYEVLEPINTDLTLWTSSLGGSTLAGDDRSRTSTREEWGLWVQAPAGGGMFRAVVRAHGASRCVEYDLQLDQDACTDPREDDDKAEARKPVEPGKAEFLTLFDGDDDHFDLSALPSGSCSVRYRPEKGVNIQRITGTLYTSSGATGPVAKSAGTDDVTLTFRWTAANKVTRLVLSAAEQMCQPYAIRCVP